MNESSKNITDTHSFTNSLINEHSPYLLQHSHNPVNQFPQRQDTFDLAEKQNKPIFLSIGYSTCHWCHVMEHESFEDEKIANFLNENFVSIKVDREERPDVDKVYMTYAQYSVGSAGQPLSVFLCPNLKPFSAGTYFPPTSRNGIPGFLDVLMRINQLWKTRPQELLDSSEIGIDILKNSIDQFTLGSFHEGDINIQFVNKIEGLFFETMKSRFDSIFGGFGPAPKFLRPSELNLLLKISQSYSNKNETSKQEIETIVNESSLMFLKTLAKMALGGIHDHIGGGFHRYSVDECQHVPHFEKMLYDNAQLLKLYVDAYCLSSNNDYTQLYNPKMFREVALKIYTFLCRDMRDDKGGFYCAQDADSKVLGDKGSKSVEGAFYVQRRSEIEQVLLRGVGKSTEESLKNEIELFCDYYSIKENGNCNFSIKSDPHNEFSGLNVPIILVQDFANFCKQKTKGKIIEKGEIEKLNNRFDYFKHFLFETRSQRPKPNLDDKIITSQNGQLISSLCHAYKQFMVTDSINSANSEGVCVPQYVHQYLQTAIDCAEFLYGNLWQKFSEESSCSAGTSKQDGNKELVGGQLYRNYYRNQRSNVEAFVDDYANLISGLLNLYEVSGDIKQLKWAIELQHNQDKLFQDFNNGGYFSSSGQDSLLVLRLKDDYDGAEPSYNSVSMQNLLRLSRLFNDSNLYLKAQKLALFFAKRLEKLPISMPQLIVSFDEFVKQQRLYVISFELNSKNFTSENGNNQNQDLRNKLMKSIQSAGNLTNKDNSSSKNYVIAYADQSDGQKFLASKYSFYDINTLKPLQPTRPTLFMCKEYACQRPLQDFNEIEKAINT